MKTKLKSLLYLFAFVATAAIYQSIDSSPEKVTVQQEADIIGQGEMATAEIQPM